MKIEKIELAKEALIALISAAIVAIALLTYGFFYGPFMKKLRIKYSEYKSIESELQRAYGIIEAADKVSMKSIVMTEQDSSLAIDELTKHGKAESIDFISMTPRDIRTEGQYEILPIEMEIKSTYMELGNFLGSLDELEKSLITVRNFRVIPDRNDPTVMKTELAINTYLLRQEYAE
jgi:Tfp pilus assembly protein PilO